MRAALALMVLVCAATVIAHPTLLVFLLLASLFFLAAVLGLLKFLCRFTGSPYPRDISTSSSGRLPGITASSGRGGSTPPACFLNPVIKPEETD